MNKEEISRLSEPNKEFADFLRKNASALPPKPDWTNIPALREGRSKMEAARLAALGSPAPHVEEEFSTIKMRDGFESKVKIYRPAAAARTTGGGKDSGRPLIVLVFGGGFVVGDYQQLTPYGRGFARAFDAVCVTISYRLAPEHKFPAAPRDVEDSLLWIDRNAEGTLGADPGAGFVLGGISAGGNLSATVAQKTLVDKSLTHPLTGLWLSVPVIFSNDTSLVPEEYKDLFFSRTQNADVPGFDKTAMDAVLDHLQPDISSELFSPFNSKQPHKGLPPTYISVDGMDPLRDDGLIYERVLKDNGVKTRLDVWPGVPHAHYAFFPMLEISKKALVDTYDGVAWLLGKDVSVEKIKEVMVAPSSG